MNIILTTFFSIYLLIIFILYKKSRFSFMYFLKGSFNNYDTKLILTDLFLAFICVGVLSQIIINNSFLITQIIKGLLLLSIFFTLKSFAYFIVKLIKK